jgi:cytochrome c oxidase accessory protein FixG
VWTDLMITIERFWQGDRNSRIRLDKEPWGAAKLFRKAMTHLSWLLVGLLTGGALVFYFRDAPTLAYELVTGTAPIIAYLFLGIFTLTTYVLGGLAREQVCTYMCPWPRIQGAMTDQHSLLISYRVQRGEPRGPVRKTTTGTIDWSSRGDCIDCKACIAVCPAGIDIRDGSQLECIQCALCIDACDVIMGKVGRPPGLIAYDTIARLNALPAGHRVPVPLVRLRTVFYAGLMAIVGGIMAVAWVNRTILEVNVLPERNPPYVLLSDGGVRNSYTVKVLNKLHEPRTMDVSVEGLPDARFTIVGVSDAKRVVVATDDLRELRVFVTLPRSVIGRSASALPLDLVVRDAQSGVRAARRTSFQLPTDRGRS